MAGHSFLVPVKYFDSFYSSKQSAKDSELILRIYNFIIVSEFVVSP